MDGCDPDVEYADNAVDAYWAVDGDHVDVVHIGGDIADHAPHGEPVEDDNLEGEVVDDAPHKEPTDNTVEAY